MIKFRFASSMPAKKCKNAGGYLHLTQHPVLGKSVGIRGGEDLLIDDNLRRHPSE